VRAPSHLETLAGQNAELAIVTAFQMFMIAIALVAGLLFSNALVRQRTVD